MRELSRVLFPLLHHVVPLNDGNCRLSIPDLKVRCARDALSQAFDIGVSKWGKTILQQYSGPANKPAAMAKLISFPAKITTVML